MKELLNAIKAQLQTDLTYIRDGDIYITPHENYIPNHVRPPCVGIKDGPVVKEHLMGGCARYSMSVSIVAFVQLAKDEASIIGDSSTSKKGVLDISDDIETSLDDNLLSITGMQAALCSGSAESELFGDERETLQRKIITCNYEKEE